MKSKEKITITADELSWTLGAVIAETMIREKDEDRRMMALSYGTLVGLRLFEKLFIEKEEEK